MKIIAHIEELKAALRERRSSGAAHKVGFVPTMGFLHEGHQSLLERARAENDTVVLSIFVNPLQFGPNEDFDRYPRDLERDAAIADSSGADYVFMPAVEEMYPVYPLETKVIVGSAAERLCGASRPGHFDGVATVVMKLFHIVQPDRAYFGMKDAQQVAVIEQLVRDLNVPVEIVPCPTIREADGLAKSSRNVYLSEAERSQAAVLYEALNEAERILRHKPMKAAELERRVRQVINEKPLASIDYVSVLSFPSLEPLDEDFPVQEALKRARDEQLIVALAVKFGRTRLIDNRLISFRKV